MSRTLASLCFVDSSIFFSFLLDEMVDSGQQVGFASPMAGLLLHSCTALGNMPWVRSQHLCLWATRLSWSCRTGVAVGLRVETHMRPGEQLALHGISSHIDPSKESQYHVDFMYVQRCPTWTLIHQRSQILHCMDDPDCQGQP